MCASTNCWDEEKFAPKLASNVAINMANVASKLAASNPGVLGASSRTARGVQGVSCANCLTIYMPDSGFCRKCGEARPTVQSPFKKKDRGIGSDVDQQTTHTENAAVAESETHIGLVRMGTETDQLADQLAIHVEPDDHDTATSKHSSATIVPMNNPESMS